MKMLYLVLPLKNLLTVLSRWLIKKYHSDLPTMLPLDLGDECVGGDFDSCIELRCDGLPEPVHKFCLTRCWFNCNCLSDSRKCHDCFLSRCGTVPYISVLACMRQHHCVDEIGRPCCDFVS